MMNKIILAAISVASVSSVSLNVQAENFFIQKLGEYAIGVMKGVSDAVNDATGKSEGTT